MAAGLQKTDRASGVAGVTGARRRASTLVRKIAPLAAILCTSLLFMAVHPAAAAASSPQDKPITSARAVPNRKGHSRRASSPRRVRPRAAKQVIRERVDSDGWMGSTDRKEDRFIHDLARFRSSHREETLDLNR